MRLRTFALIGVVTLALAACGWAQPGFDAGHSRFDNLETSLTAATVGGLTQHTMTVAGHPITSFFVVRSWLIVNTDAGATAFDRATCPRSDNGACTPAWSRPGEQFRSSDGASVMFFTTGASTFDAVDFSGTRVWSGTTLGDPNGFAPAAFTHGDGGFVVAGPNLIVEVSEYAQHGNDTSTANVFPLAGCGAPSCGPASHYVLATFPQGFEPRISVAADRLVTQLGSTADARIITTGQEVWRADQTLTFALLAHGRDAYAATLPALSTYEVFDVDGIHNCTGNPTVCSPVRTLSTDALYAVSDAVAVGATHPTNGTTALGLFATDGTGCVGAPLTCAPTATTTALGSAISGAVVTPQLVIAAGWNAQGSHLAVFDAHQQSGCVGAPKVCSPLVDLPISAQAVRSEPIDGLEVWDGRVYALTGDGVLHVFARPASAS